MSLKQKLILLCIIFISSTAIQAQTFTISGYIEDQSTGEKLLAANVFDRAASNGTITNTYGFYSYTSSGACQLEYSYIGYESKEIELNLTRDTVINISLKSESLIEEIEINATRSKKIQEETQMSTVEIPIAQIKSIPAFLGEVDVLKALQLLPGVQSGGEGQSGLYVRGGSPDQNLILLDGVPVYNASHLFGFFSVFNADALKDVKLIKGGFPARYGGRLSSVLEINMKEGNSKEIKGAGSVGIVASKFTLEGPIITDKTSFIVSARRTYIDVLAKPFIQSSLKSEGQQGGTGYYFYDLNAKVNHKFSDKDRLYLSLYTGKDKFYFNSKETDGNFRDIIDTGLGWGNITSALRWNHLITPKLFMNSTLSLSDYELDTRAKYGTEYVLEDATDEISLSYISGIRDWAGRLDFDYVPNPNHYIKFGGQLIHHKFKPGVFNLKEVDTRNDRNFEIQLGQANINSIEYAAYVEDDMKIGSNLKINAGLHFSGFSVDGTNYTSLQPRLSSRYLLNENSSIKASFATMRQYIHLLAFEGIGLPTDLWLPTTDRVKPQDAWQVALGYAQGIGDDYELSVEGYFKKMSNVISYKEGSGVFEFSDWEDRVIQGDGEAYGAEVLLQKKYGRLTGWVGYTLSWSNRQFEDLNFGEKFPYRYDRRHDISVVTTYKLTERITISGSWVYGTGNAVTLASSNYRGAIQQGDNNPNSFLASYFSDRNGFRMNAYHRMDVGINFIKQKKRYKRIWSIGAYNTYNRKNPFYIYTDTEYIEQPDGSYTEEFKLKQASLFPIIPYVNFSFEF